ncbi:hypothetical protein JDY09_03380 [Thermoleophilum album]|uniref:cupredoxin domain-containing protein n=1 Tax=Thermoleophilum album TaxID=29539 RepID=UPI00237D2608|nr:plastocyanin/azurin family copper-binding protein [Thermoleophilum album]WDT94309.1 hypothetical protein JDY09_03380 [Thermoleophilum album]
MDANRRERTADRRAGDTRRGARLAGGAVLQRLPATALLAAGCAALAVAANSRSERADAARQRQVTVKVGDYFYKPSQLRIRSGTTVVWRWPRIPGDVHDVYLARGPRGVRKFRSALAASDYTYKRRLTRRGTYRIICTLHAEMTMRIVVR